MKISDYTYETNNIYSESTKLSGKDKIAAGFERKQEPIKIKISDEAMEKLLSDQYQKSVIREEKSPEEQQEMEDADFFYRQKNFAKGYLEDSVLDPSSYYMYDALEGKVGYRAATDYVSDLMNRINGGDSILSYEERAVIREIAMKEAEEFADKYIDDEEIKKEYLDAMRKHKNDSILRDRGYILNIDGSPPSISRELQVSRSYSSNDPLNDLYKKYASEGLFKKYKEDRLNPDEYKQFMHQLFTAIPKNDGSMEYFLFRNEAKQVYNTIDKQVSSAVSYAQNYVKGKSSEELGIRLL